MDLAKQGLLASQNLERLLTPIVDVFMSERGFAVDGPAGLHDSIGFHLDYTRDGRMVCFSVTAEGREGVDDFPVSVLTKAGDLPPLDLRHTSALMATGVDERLFLLAHEDTGEIVAGKVRSLLDLLATEIGPLFEDSLAGYESLVRRVYGPFSVQDEQLVLLPSYRWLAIRPFVIEVPAVAPQEVFFALLRSGTFNRVWCPGELQYGHGPFPAGELALDDFERLSAADAKGKIVDVILGRASWMDVPDPPDERTLREVELQLGVIPLSASVWHLTVDPWVDRNRVHLWFVEWEFNEFVFIDTQSNAGWFVVIGTD